jgi:precorrin-4 C11-methyltransferase
LFGIRITELAQAKVYIVGAGPGDPDLLTLKAAQVIGKADLIIYADSLVMEEVAHLAQPGAEIVASAELTLEKILEKMVNAAKAGLTVARVHSGDPSLYGALYEQLSVLDDAGIEYEIIPGVSAVFAAAARLGVELTVPEVAQTIILTRLSGRASPVPQAENLRSLASHQTSLAIYLSITRCREVVQELLEGGYSPNTPTAVLYRVNWPDEQVIVCELHELADKVARAGFSRQSLVLVGEALAPALKRGRAGQLRSRLYHPAHSHVFRKGETTVAPVSELNTVPTSTPELLPKTQAAGLAIVSLTKQGTALAAKLEPNLSQNSAKPIEVFAPVRFAEASMQAYKGKPLELVRELFSSRTNLILIMPLAVAIRAVGALAQDKHSDPGIVVLDEAGRFAISMLGGHVGGANRLATQVAALTGGQAVITTASDIQNLPALDLLGQEWGWQIANPAHLTAASAASVNGELVGVWQETGQVELWSRWEAANLQHSPAPEPLTATEFKAALVITYRQPAVFQAALQEKAVFYHPPSLVLGVGCRRGVSSAKIEQTIQAVLAEYGLAFAAIESLASVDLKRDEEGLLEFADKYKFPLKFYSAEALNQVEATKLLSISAAQRLLGVQGVAEPAALLASGATSLLVAKVSDQDVTVAVAVRNFSLTTPV